MSIYRVVDKLETYVREGTWLPFGLRILSEERLLEYTDKLRASLPQEVGRAKVIASNKDRVLRDAQEKAQQIVTEATTTQAQLVDQSDILRQARTTAEIVLREAEEKAARYKADADEYAARVLAELEGRLATALGSVQKGQAAIAGGRAKPAAPRPKKSATAAAVPIETGADLEPAEVAG